MSRGMVAGGRGRYRVGRAGANEGASTRERWLRCVWRELQTPAHAPRYVPVGAITTGHDSIGAWETILRDLFTKRGFDSAENPFQWSPKRASAQLSALVNEFQSVSWSS